MLSSRSQSTALPLLMATSEYDGSWALWEDGTFALVDALVQ
jgi:phytoene dehydrogenase-like protein